YSVRDQKPILVEALKMKALPDGSNLRCGVYGVTLNAPKPNENPSGMQGNKNEVMKNYMNPCKS
ncbi:MAG: hypothetical protein DSO09_01155, partial [Candidatus Methanomethylicota archaeon]